MLLKWIGDPNYVQGVPGWPASDHEEPNAKTARAKLKSKFYERVEPETPPPLAEGPAQDEEAN